MPTNEWNKGWATNLAQYNRGEIKCKHYGDQWGDPEIQSHLTQVVNRFIKPFVDQSVIALEIGPGGGRWTQYLLSCKKIYCVELNPEMFAYLKKRFSGKKHIRYIQTSGSDFPGVPEQSIDFAFTFGTFVHLDFDIIRNYIRNMTRIMRHNGNISIQFSNKKKEMAENNPDFSDNSPDKMVQLLDDFCFDVVEVDDELLPHSTIIAGKYRGV
jgi:SAM-dependent methyltransferase